MATVSNLTSTGNHFIIGEYDEYTKGLPYPVNQALFVGDGTYSGDGIVGAGTLTSGSVGSVSASGPGGYYTYSWTCPTGVTSVSVVCIGGGGGGTAASDSGGSGAALAYASSISVTPGTTYTVRAGRGGIGSSGNIGAGSGGDSWFISSSILVAGGGIGAINTTTLTGGSPGGSALTGGGTGGTNSRGSASGSQGQMGGGAGGAGVYGGNGGNAGARVSSTGPLATDGSAGGGGGGQWGTTSTNGGSSGGSGGGGVGIYGIGTNGTAGVSVLNSGFAATGGGGGSAGTAGGNGGYNASYLVPSVGGVGGTYGGGGGGSSSATGNVGANGGVGAVRIIWGLGRNYPSTLTTDQVVNNGITTVRQYSNGNLAVSGELDEYTLPNIQTNFSTFATQFNGTTQRLTTTANSLTSQNFTIECWFYMTSNLTYLDGTPNYIARLIGTANVNGFELLLYGGASTTPTYIVFANVGPAQFSIANPAAITIAINQWHHVAVSRNGTSYALWFDGVRLNTGTSSFNYTAGTIYIAAAPNGQYQDWFPGRISNMRIVRGSVVYDPSLTTITVPTEPLTAITNTYLLTCQSATNIDNSGNGFTITPVASPTISSATIPLIPAVTVPKARQYSNGVYQVYGSFDEVTGII